MMQTMTNGILPRGCSKKTKLIVILIPHAVREKNLNVLRPSRCFSRSSSGINMTIEKDFLDNLAEGVLGTKKK